MHVFFALNSDLLQTDNLVLWACQAYVPGTRPGILCSTRQGEALPLHSVMLDTHIVAASTGTKIWVF